MDFVQTIGHSVLGMLDHFPIWALPGITYEEKHDD